MSMKIMRTTKMRMKILKKKRRTMRMKMTKKRTMLKIQKKKQKANEAGDHHPPPSQRTKMKRTITRKGKRKRKMMKRVGCLSRSHRPVGGRAQSVLLDPRVSATRGREEG